jgi:hypothetical protein
MASCRKCGSTIMFGGLKVGDQKFCNAKCAEGARAEIPARPQATPSGVRSAQLLMFIGFMMLVVIPNFFGKGGSGVIPLVGVIVLAVGVFRYFSVKRSSGDA